MYALRKDWADVPGEQVDEELWDQDWDDDVLDDEFSVQLRYRTTLSFTRYKV